MKNYFSKIIYFLGISIVIFASCKEDEDCLNCLNEDIVTQTFLIGNTADSNIIIYPVITPSNHPMCDSMVYNPVMGAYVYPYMVHSYQKLCTVQEAIDSLAAGNDTVCPCRINPDSTFNDDLNAYFHIGNISKFPYNRLYIKTVNDTTKLRTYTDYDNRNNLFIGEVSMDTTQGYYQYNNTKPLSSGVYTYMIVIYKDETHHQQLGDTLKGNFAIIRTDKDVNRNCKAQAFDENDPLLK